MSTLKVNSITDATGGSNAQLYGVASPPNSMGFRNRILNGGMVIDQRNAGASVTLNNTAAYTLDRWYDRCVGGAGSAVITVQRSTVAPAGFTNSSLITVTTAKTPAASEQFWRYQAIEGFNAADFAFGSASAATVTLSFWVRSSVTGTYSVAFQNSAQNRSYVATYTINSANTWEQKTVTISGDTSGTWLTDNGIGLFVFFDTGSGSNLNTTAGAWGAGTFYRTSGSVSLISNSGATFYITGVQLEAGTVASPFERRDYGRELMMCQRYYYKVQATGDNSIFGIGMATSSTVADCLINFPVSMRTAPSSLEQSGTATQYRLRQGGTEITCSAVPSFVFTSTLTTSTVRGTVASGLTAASAIPLRSTSADAYLAWSAEL